MRSPATVAHHFSETNCPSLPWQERRNIPVYFGQDILRCLKIRTPIFPRGRAPVFVGNVPCVRYACGFHTGQIPRDLLQQAVDILPVRGEEDMGRMVIEVPEELAELGKAMA